MLIVVQVIVDDGRLPLGLVVGHLEASPLAEGGEGVVDVQLAAVHGRPQGAEGRGRPGDVHIVLVVRRRVRVRVRVGIGWWEGGVRRGEGGLLLLGWRSTARGPGTRGDSGSGAG